jgi:hypothetical protein
MFVERKNDFKSNHLLHCKRALARDWQARQATLLEKDILIRNEPMTLIVKSQKKIRHIYTLTFYVLCRIIKPTLLTCF